MNYIKSNVKYIFSNIFSKELPKPLGRWRIEQSDSQLNRKIDLSNEDHCGPCGEYAKDKQSNNGMKKI